MWVWIKRIFVSLAMIGVFCCAIEAFSETYNKTAGFMVMNILLLLLPLLNIVLYFIAAGEKSFLVFFAACVQVVLEAVMVFNMEVLVHAIGAVITGMVLIAPMIIYLSSTGALKRGGAMLMGLASSAGFIFAIYECIKEIFFGK